MDGWIKSHHHLDSDGSLTILRTQDVEPILELNKHYQNTPQTKSEFMGHHLASIPNIIIEKWANEDGINILETAKHGKKAIGQFIKRKLADPDWRYLKAR
jgi:hypothetical protein